MTRTTIIVAALVGAALTHNANAGVLALPQTPNGYSICQGGICVWGEGSLPNPYIRHVPEPQTEAEKAEAARRDHEWMLACEPKLIRDRYGVMRYAYSKPGCEFGSPE